MHTAGYAPNVTAVDWPAYAGGPRGLEGYRVRTGDFPTHAAAATLATTLKGLGFTTAAAGTWLAQHAVAGHPLAVIAMNLDGGGSTAFAVNGVQVNHPAYATGERSVGNFVAVLPENHG